ncbi:MAG TPA: hypothetical protein VGC42_06885 [Kofleriaceae bacterium]
MIKLVVGILKGAVIGAGIGYGAFALDKATGFSSPWLTYGVIGALVGLIAGRSIWSLIRDKNATSWVGVLKAGFGFGIGCGLYALVSRVWSPGGTLMVMGQNAFTWPVTLGGAIGAVWGGFVELDDAIGADPKDGKDAKPAARTAIKPSPAKKPTKN